MPGMNGFEMLEGIYNRDLCGIFNCLQWTRY
jgi:hypothetical protein